MQKYLRDEIILGWFHSFGGWDSLGEVRFLPLDWRHRNRNTGKIESMYLRACLAAGPGLDFMTRIGTVLMMKEKGVLKTLWQTDEQNDHIYGLGYDGRYLWFSVERQRGLPRILVLDPDTLKTWEFTAEHGLPLVETKNLPNFDARQVIDLAPLGPGRVCLTGSFGRTWLAIATFDPKGIRSVKVFHEAREASQANVPNQHKRTTIAFQPGRMFECLC